MKKRLLFVVESLSGGGAEKVLSVLLKFFDHNKYQITICPIVDTGIYCEEVKKYVDFYSPIVSYHGNFIRKFWNKIKYKLIYSILPLRWVYWCFIPKNNGVEIAFCEGFATKLLSYSTNYKAKRFTWVHCDLKSQPWPILQGIYRDKEEEADVYRKYDKVVCVSRQTEHVMKDYYGLSNTITIYNPLDNGEILQSSKHICPLKVKSSQFNIISVGRLEQVKGFDLLIPIIRSIREKGMDVHLWIVGEGTEDNALKLLTKEQGVEKNVTFTGFMKNPYSLMSQMDLFVCSSRAEGFSLVIAEAMLLGIPVVSMNCAGPKELIALCGVGTLCNSIEELEQAIEDKSKEKNYCEKGKMIFDVKEVVLQIEKLWTAS